MNRIPFMVASAAIGLALVFGVTRELTAASSSRVVPPGNCYYSLYNCSYEDSNAYWSGCSPTYPQGLISTTLAAQICTTYHEF